MTSNTKNVIIIGGGASGIFTAIQLQSIMPNINVCVLEKYAKPLSKLKVSGGGRCNVTHRPYDIQQFALNYPRENNRVKRLLHSFSAQDMIDWLQQKGVAISVEKDGRVFPETSSSQTIIDCFLDEAAKLGISIHYKENVTNITKSNAHFQITTKTNNFVADAVVVASGSAKDMQECARNFGMKIIEHAPSLFTFTCKEKYISALSGISVDYGRVRIPTLKKSYEGSVLITHFGFSGPAVLKLSAFCARELYEHQYNIPFEICWNYNCNEETLRKNLLQNNSLKNSLHSSLKEYTKLPSRLISTLVNFSGVSKTSLLSKKEIEKIIAAFFHTTFQMNGTCVNKEEFVTAGGICYSEVDTKTMGSKKVAGLFFAGEVMNSDGITGGFNFQHAWSTSFVAARGVASFL